MRPVRPLQGAPRGKNNVHGNAVRFAARRAVSVLALRPLWWGPSLAARGARAGRACRRQAKSRLT
ncbi:MAG: hypothetical protein OHK0028_15820 [Deltaproteobacteria bacterium]